MDPRLPSLFISVLHRHRRPSAAADVESPNDNHFSRLEDLSQIVANRVHDALVKDSLVAEGEEIELEAFHLDAQLVGHVADGDGGEIGLAGHGAEAGEFGEDKFDLIIAAGARVFKDFQNRPRVLDLRFAEFRAAAKLRDLWRCPRSFGHAPILRRPADRIRAG